MEDLLKTLTTKGFHPAKNPGFMEKFLLIRADSASTLNLNLTPSTWPRESHDGVVPRRVLGLRLRRAVPAAREGEARAGLPRDRVARAI